MATMNSICIPRVSAHYDEVDVRDAINIGFDGEFVDKIDVRYTQDSRGQNLQVMFVHFLPKEGNEHTTRFFQRLEKNGEVNFYTGKTNRKTGERFYWKIRKVIKKERAEPVVARPGLMSEEDETKLVVSKQQQAALPKVEREEGEINESEASEEEETETNESEETENKDGV
jgi:hypothetical protein